MTKRISKKLREEAAIACSMMAAARAWHGWAACRTPDYFEVPCSRAAIALAKKAHNATPFLWSRDARGNLVPDYHAEYAEAESLLRTGWTPEGWS